MNPRLRDPFGTHPNMTWASLRGAASLHDPGLRPVLPAGTGCCALCRGPASAGYSHCFHCALHRRSAPGLLADVVAPISYSVAGTAYSKALWQYKSDQADRDQAGSALRVVLLVFLRDHGRCLWPHAGATAPTHVAVVPSGRGRPGVHPLRRLVEPYLTLPWADLVIASSEPVQGRELCMGRFRVTERLTGATVLLLDDTWTSGASAQSAAAALKLAGARSVATVVLGRHVNPSDRGACFLLAAVGARSFRWDACALHGSTAWNAAA